jgi:hypothetical protein
VIRDESGKLSLINVFQNIELAGFPGGMARLCLVVGLDADPGDTLQISIEPPGKNSPLLQMDYQVEESDRPRKKFQQAIFQLVGEARPAVFSIPGVYHVVIRTQGRTVYRHPFGVLPMDIPQETSDVVG